MTDNHFDLPTDKETSMRHEQASIRYVDAYDRDDLDTIAQLWKEAETDPKLEQLLIELNEGLLHENNLPMADPAREKVLGMLRQTVPSAFAVGQLEITISDVASAISSDRVTLSKLSPADREVNIKLLAVRDALPAKLDGAAMLELSRNMSVAASPAYWRAFQQAGVLLNMSRGGAGRAAARQARPPRTPKQDDKEKR